MVKLHTLIMSYLSQNHRIAESTKETAERAFSYLVMAVGDIEIDKFEYEHAERFQNWIVESGRNKVTANIYVKMVSPVFSWAVRKKLIPQNAFNGLKLFKLAKRRIRIYEPAEFEAMLSSCPNRLWQARLLLAKTAGLRRGEVLNLTLDDIDFNRNIIYIQTKRETRHTWHWEPKDRDLRELPLVPEVGKLLIDISLDLSEGQPYLMFTSERYSGIVKLKEQGLLSNRVRRCPDENFARPMRQILRRAGVKRGTFHDLRRTCITEWLESGLQPHEVRVLAGHSDLETTMTYYSTTRRSLLSKARKASSGAINWGYRPQSATPSSYIQIGATGLEPATS